MENGDLQTAPLFFPLVISRTCPNCSSVNYRFEWYEQDDDKPYRYKCNDCKEDWSEPDFEEALRELEWEKNQFLERHKKVIQKALKANTTFNSFGKRKINYSKFIPELLNFFQDNTDTLQSDAFSDISISFSISEEGVDEVADFLDEFGDVKSE